MLFFNKSSKFSLFSNSLKSTVIYSRRVQTYSRKIELLQSDIYRELPCNYVILMGKWKPFN